MEHRTRWLTMVHKKKLEERNNSKEWWEIMKSKGTSLKQTVNPKCSRRMHTRTTTEMVSYHVQDVFPQSPVELWDTLCSQDHANHGVICSRPTGKDTVGGTDWWDTRHISILGFWFIWLSMVQRRCRTSRDQTKKISWSLPSHSISHRRNAQQVGGGQETKAPSSITFLWVVSGDSVRIVFTISSLNELDVLACDIQNTYLIALCRKHTLMLVKMALY